MWSQIQSRVTQERMRDVQLFLKASGHRTLYFRTPVDAEILVQISGLVNK